MPSPSVAPARLFEAPSTSTNNGYAAPLPVGRFAQIAAPLVKEGLSYRMNGCIKTTGRRYGAATSRTRGTLCAIRMPDFLVFKEK